MFDMAASSLKLIWRIMCILTMTTPSTSIRLVSSSHWTCNPLANTFLLDLHIRCPLSISSSLPLEMDGETLEQVLSSTSMNVYTAVLFYDSESPFSSGMRSKFDKLSSMFPQISHIAVEKSLAMPSLFSRYGVHSLPALFIMNQTAKMRYYGPKDLQVLAHFYKIATGLDPVEYHGHYNSKEKMEDQIILQPWYQLSLKEIIEKEPYLVLAILFLMLRAFLYFCPEIMARVTALWMLCKRQFNLGIFGESSQLVGRVLHLIDVKRVWSKLKFCKTRNFQKGARSASVWASSLASVSLGETSSARPSPSVES